MSGAVAGRRADGRAGAAGTAGALAAGGPDDAPVGSGRVGGTGPGCAAGGHEALRIRPWVRYRKDEVYEICAALALAEALLARAGRPEDASRMATVFALAEGGLAR